MSNNSIIRKKEKTSCEQVRLREDSLQFITKVCRLGMDVLPLKGKAPIEKGWSTRLPLEAQQIKEYFKPRTHNIGIRTGKVSGIVVVDLDDPTSMSWAESSLPQTPMATKTGKRTDQCPEGGLHLYYRYPADGVVRSCDPTITTDDNLTIRIEVRSDGRQVVAPYSVHPDSGMEYEAIGSWSTLDDVPVFDPVWVATDEIITPVPSHSENPDSDISCTSTGEWYRKNGHTVPEGARNKTLFTAACDYAAKEVAVEMAHDELMPKAIASGLGYTESKSTIDSAYSRPRTATQRKNTSADACTKPMFEMTASQEIARSCGDVKPGYWGNLIQAGMLTLFVGAEKSGKSTFLHTLYRFFSTGGEFIYPVTRCKIAVCSEEPDELWSQYHDLNDWQDDTVHVIPCHTFLTLQPSRKREEFRTAMKDLGAHCVEAGISILVFDTFRKLFPLDSYDDAAQVKKVVDPVKTILCHECGLAVVLVHHAKKNSKDCTSPTAVASGSNLLAAEADRVLLFNRAPEGKRNMRRLSIYGRLVQGEHDFEFDEMHHIYRPVLGQGVERYSSTNRKIWELVPQEWTTPKAIVQKAAAINVKKSTVYTALALGLQEKYLAVDRVGVKNAKMYRRTEKPITTIVSEINGGEGAVE